MLRDLLVQDAAMEHRLAKIGQPRLRVATIVGVSCVCGVAVLLFAVEGGNFRFVYIVMGLALGIYSLVRFRKEKAIVSGFGRAVGTVLVYKKWGGGQGARGSASIKYGFLTTDTAMAMGNAKGPVSLAREGKTVAVLYSVEDCSVNLPVECFRFYKFGDEFAAAIGLGK